MPDKKFDLGDYVEVKDRIARFYDLFGQGRLATEYILTSEPDDKPKVICRALAYRTPDDIHPATGHSWMYLPGTTTYTRGSELENTETSAVGRAIGMLGILIDRSIASAQEVANKEGPIVHTGRAPDPDPASIDRETGEIRQEPFETTVEGKMSAGAAPADLQFRQTPNGLIFGFVVEAEGRKRLKVMVEDGLAVALQAAGADSLKGVWVTVEGRIERIPWKKGDRDMPPYQQMTLARIVTPEWTLPAPSLTEPFTAEDVAELENANVEPLWPEDVS